MGLTSPTPALAPQLGLLGSPPDPVGRFPMRGGPSAGIVIYTAVGAGNVGGYISAFSGQHTHQRVVAQQMVVYQRRCCVQTYQHIAYYGTRFM